VCGARGCRVLLLGEHTDALATSLDTVLLPCADATVGHCCSGHSCRTHTAALIQPTCIGQGTQL
jgi:hypothetical protein